MDWLQFFASVIDPIFAWASWGVIPEMTKARVRRPKVIRAVYGPIMNIRPDGAVALHQSLHLRCGRRRAKKHVQLDPEVVGTDHCGFAGRLMLGSMPAVRRRYSAWLGDLQTSLDPLHRVGKDQPALSRAA